MSKTCPCGSPRAKTDCCEAIISGKRQALTAEELMRSRYLAFTKADINYLMRSHHKSTRPLKDRTAIQKWAASVQWMALKVLNTSFGKENDQTGYVEFRAVYLEKGQLQEIHENSFFKKEKGEWFYVSGVHR